MIINGEKILGLEILEEEPNFSYKGCENCGKGYGDDVFPVAAIVEQKQCGTKERPDTADDWYNIDLCNACLCAYNNGDHLEEGCKNKFKI